MIYIFDMDGTLVDSSDAHAESFIKAFKLENKIITKKAVKDLMGLSGKDIVKILGASNFDETYKNKKKFFSKVIDRVKSLDGATEVLTQLKKQGHTICIATSASRDTAEAILKKFNWPIDFLITATDVKHAKPHPEMIETIREKFEGKMIMIGDAKFDREMSKNAEIPCLILGDEIKTLYDILKHKV